MRIAYAVKSCTENEEGKYEISEEFARAPCFLLEENGDTVAVISNPYSLSQGDVSEYVINILVGYFVDTVVAGNFGERAKILLKDRDIQYRKV